MAKSNTNKNSKATRVKTHTTVKVTERLLKSRRACSGGLHRMEPFLPATLHTDVEKNLDLAISMIDHINALFRYSEPLVRLNDVHWLTLTLNLESDVTDNGYLIGDTCRTINNFDASVVAQRLAAIADKLATEAGR